MAGQISGKSLDHCAISQQPAGSSRGPIDSSTALKMEMRHGTPSLVLPALSALKQTNVDLIDGGVETTVVEEGKEQK